MSTSNRESSKIGYAAQNFINSNLNYLRELPPPGDRWVSSNQAPGVGKRLDRCIEYGIITQGERVRKSNQACWYRTDRRAYEYLQERLGVVDVLPCGHTGLSNLGGNQFGCGYELCGRVFGRGVVEECLG